VIREAIACDTEFLARCQIMDYSLLVGIDGESRFTSRSLCRLADNSLVTDVNKTLVVGLIDILGSACWSAMGSMATASDSAAVLLSLRLCQVGRVEK
jgi:hypothetical protein